VKLSGKKNKLVIPLIIITFAVWGMIIYNLIDYYLSSSNEEEKIVIDNNKLPETKSRKASGLSEEITYKELARDPFTFSRKMEKTIEPVQPVVQHIEPPKPQFMYKINGAIINDKSKLIIFEDQTNHQTLFLREGETYNGIKIKSITITKAIVVEDGKTKEVIVSN
jgi:type II secretory pathway component PulC